MKINKHSLRLRFMASSHSASSGSSLRTIAASPIPAGHEQEVSSVRQDGFVPVLSKEEEKGSSQD
ncbi:hypothetical protein E2562_026687 [Oryza meyeriana var. granulata]|uniref:Uncharacterized protein n=1 Tax=Oryza meyeriana var. granulata TaxID=110450 RepID=A0A6G1E2Y0_9ORYZ|nr:hypothetical protein E2562_026687 [Oryza meyeriana var. granulata]